MKIHNRLQHGANTRQSGCDFKANFAAGNGKSNDNAELGLYRNNCELRPILHTFKLPTKII